MPRLDFSWTVTINAPVEQVFSYLRDPENMWHMPGVEIADVKVTPEGVGTTVRNVFALPGLKHLGITGNVIIETIEFVPNRRIVTKPTPMMGRMIKFDGTWTWTFEPKNGGTKLTVDYTELANWLVYAFDKLTEKKQNKEMNVWLAGLKTTLEAPSRLSGSGADRPDHR
jgi:uncharacterized protein YndB with AHSA1/START domain